MGSPDCARTAAARSTDVRDSPSDRLSLSYAPGLVAIAVADEPVGVDVEAIGPAPAGFADRLAWTRAEAVLKLTGEGVRRDPATVRDDEAWTRTLSAPTGYVASLAAAASVELSERTETAVVPRSSSHGPSSDLTSAPVRTAAKSRKSGRS